MQRRHTRTTLLTLAAAGSLVLAGCGGGSGFSDSSSSGSPTAPSTAKGKADLTILIASSGDAETNAVKAAAAAWSKKTGNKATVQVASNMDQQLAQGFAGGNPPDVFYLDASKVADNAKAGNLYPYTADKNDQFYPALRKAFTYDGKQYCAPKDVSTLALQINTADWKKAGLTAADYPTTWDQLAKDAKALTKPGRVGLAFSPGIDRAGVFVVQDGGWWMNDDSTKPTADTPAVKDALGYVQKQLQSGSFALSSDLGTGWGGEAFGTGKAAMTIEGNWIKGAMKSDYPKVAYKSVALPKGPKGEGTLLFSNCWGVAAQSKSQAQAVDLVNFLTSSAQQMKFADAFGVMPSRQPAAAEYKKKFPEDAAFVTGVDHGHGPINAAGLTQVIADLNSKMESLKNANLDTMLGSFDTNAKAALKK